MVKLFDNNNKSDELNKKTIDNILDTIESDAKNVGTYFRMGDYKEASDELGEILHHAEELRNYINKKYIH